MEVLVVGAVPSKPLADLSREGFLSEYLDKGVQTRRARTLDRP